MGINNKYLYLIVIIIIIFISSDNAVAQVNKYFIKFTDKNDSPYSINNPSQFLSQAAIDRRSRQNISLKLNDLPVNPNYLQELRTLGAEVIFGSKWLNGALVYADPSQIALINQLTFVAYSNQASGQTATHNKSQNEVNLTVSSALSIDYGSSNNQLSMIGIDQMHEQGYYGQGVTIAIIDGGFKNANVLPIFDSLFQNNRILSTYDFVDQETDVYNDHEHGTQVLSVLAGYLSGQLMGSVWRAKYILLRSEDAYPESISEEINWVRAAEYADSAGADIINSSLGYNTFDNSTSDHTYSDLDGNTTLITQGADIAASKGILVINSAGNYGNDLWKYILAPADGDSVLTVGAVISDGSYSPLSSIGPTYDGRIKPDLAAQGISVIVASPFGGITSNSGTSFAAPLITGLAAGLWQAFPNLGNMEIIDFIRKSGSQYFNPDNFTGYGIPNFSNAKNLVLANNDIVEVNKGNIYVYPNPVEIEPLILNLPKNLTGKQITIKFIDLMGKVVAQEVLSSGKLRNDLSTNMEDWSNGVYFLHIDISGAHQIVKLFKK